MPYHKLYKIYYPVKDEELLQLLLQDHKAELKTILQNELKRLEIHEFRRNDTYARQLKNEFSFFGNLKPKNVIHNRFILSEWEYDRELHTVKSDYEKTTGMLDKFDMNEQITIEEVNEILQIAHEQFLADISPLILAVVAIGFVLLVL